MLKRFELRENKSSVKSEFFGGLATFLASFYILIVNPSMLSLAGLPYSAVLTGTVLIASLSTILMGVVANNPVLLAPGMGLNAFFTFTVILGNKVPPEVALGIVFWSGILFMILSALKVREKIIHFIPSHLRYAISCGIGLFITFIGLEKGGVIVDHPATLVQMAPFSPKLMVFFASLFITGILVYKNVKGNLILGIFLTFILSIPLGLIEWKGVLSTPDFSWFGKLNLKDSFHLSLVPTILAFMFTDMFDTISTLLGVSHAGHLLDENGNPRNMKKSLLVDAIATTLSGVFGTSPTTSYIESAAGIQQGARTGLASVFAGLFFLPFLFFAPLLSTFPVFTTTPILVIVGLFMLGPLTHIDWKKFEIALPSFLTMILIPLTFSITQGMIVGLISHYFFVIMRKGLK